MKLPRIPFSLRRKVLASSPEAPTESSAAPAPQTEPPKTVGMLGTGFAKLKRSLGSNTRWLLLAWDIGGLRGVIADGDHRRCEIIASAESGEAHFPAALADVLEQLEASGEKLPHHAALAARHMRPAVVNLPVHPNKPRPDAQMRELLRGDMEPVLAEFGALWTMGSLLHARGHLTAADRDRVTLEETLRREERRTPLRFGETALELALIDRATLNECLEVQDSLQYLDSDLLSTWKGRVEHGEKHWLASAVTSRLYRHWDESLSKHRIKLECALPLAWLVSEGSAGAAGATEENGETQHIGFELHSEEVVVVRRLHGHVVAARTDGRLERPLQSNWLQRLIDDWISEGRADITLACLDVVDEAAAVQAASDLELTSGHQARIVPASETWTALWPVLLREATSAVPECRIPRLSERELLGKPWKNPDFVRVGILAVIVFALAATEGLQRYQLGALRQTLAENAKKENEEQKRAQLTLKAGAEVQQVARELEAVRQALEPLVNERTRLEAIAAMRQYLPDLMLTLGQAVGNDAVLEKVGNSRVDNDATAIRVEAWSPSYTGAQDFINRVAEQTRALNYGVSQTEVREERGRTNKTGYRVGFWLVQEPDELEQPLSPTSPQPPRNTAPRPTASGISSQARGVP